MAPSLDAARLLLVSFESFVARFHQQVMSQADVIWFQVPAYQPKYIMGPISHTAAVVIVASYQWYKRNT